MSVGLLLDLDGTLADSLGVMRLAFGRFVSAHGGQDTDVEFQRFNGPPLPEIIRVLKAELRLSAPVVDLLAEYESSVDDLYEGIAPVAAAVELMAAANDAGWRIGVVSSNSSRRVKRWLEHTNLARYCTVVVCGDEVPRGKPHPVPYVEALCRLSLPAEEVLVIEDSVLGALAALGAGLRTFGYEPPDRPAPKWPPGVVPFACFDHLQRTLGIGSHNRV